MSGQSPSVSTGAMESRNAAPGFETLAAAREGWERLADRSGNVFATWEWASAWWRHYGNGKTLRLGACRGPAGELTAILPLYRGSAGPLRMLRFVGHGPSDELGPVCAPEHRPEAFLSLAKEIEGARPRWDLFLADRIGPGAPAGWLPRSRSLRREASPVLPIRGRSWEDFLADQSSNFRRQLRYKERRLDREQGLRYRLATEPERLGADMETLFHLHEARWAGGSSGALASTRRAFHRDFAARALERGWLRLWIAEVDGRPAAAWYGFRFGGDEWYYQAGRDPQWDRHSLGLLLLVHSIREAVGDGMRSYRFLRGGEEYKFRFEPDDAPVETLVAGRGAAGRVALAAASGVTHLPPSARRWARRVVPA